MQTNIKPDNCPNAALPASITGFEENRFSEINADNFEDRIGGTDPMFAAMKIIRKARAKEALAETARKKAELANTAKSDFLMNLSHEIRTPMGAIIGLSQILLSSGLDDKQKQYVSVLQNSAEALMVMINKTLDIGRIESGTIELQNASFDMAALLDQVIGIMSIKAQEKNVGLILHYETGAPKRFFGDGGRIRQIIMNLIGNAIKFTEEGKVTVLFTVDKSDISISVADTGIGIAKNKIGIIFDRFAQANPSIGRKYGGTGLGLSISKALAEEMGGTIAVTSEVGKGSTFVLDLRLEGEDGYGKPELYYQKNVIYAEVKMPKFDFVQTGNPSNKIQEKCSA